MQTEICSSLAELSAAEWNRLNPDGYPFTRYEFLVALERHGCVGRGTGWHPRHLLLRDRQHRLVGALPLYLKDHSMGEFVFDWAWADAYERHGLAYYPRLVAAVPFTPVTGPRLLTPGAEALRSSATDPAQVRRTLADAAVEYARELGVSSLHCLFPGEDDRDSLARQGLLLRKACQFHWHNHGYAEFDDLLGAFSSAKRKKIRRERRRVSEAGIRMERVRGDRLDPALWPAIHRLYASTYHMRGRLPYLGRPFFEEISRTMGEQLVLVLAWTRGNLPVAAAITLRDDAALYGRHWGADADYHSLHFEACYYQGLEYCIEAGLARFDPGTQGEHKVSRGFLPVATWSAHWIADPRFRDAIADFVQREVRYVDGYIEEMRTHSPYRSGDAAGAAS
ncbi:MAG TPA: GNAT family N-acetyltransferase [Gammaproteobacteria bacterium]|nr:GNAT family N-acetyltransferase [Gammaproteobacteria bacterium]